MMMIRFHHERLVDMASRPTDRTTHRPASANPTATAGRTPEPGDHEGAGQTNEPPSHGENIKEDNGRIKRNINYTTIRCCAWEYNRKFMDFVYRK